MRDLSLNSRGLVKRFFHMDQEIILASGSEIRRALLRNAGLGVTVLPARVDEEAVKASLLAESVSPREIADALAELKAAKVSDKAPGALVIGCDQVLNLDGHIVSKPATPEDARIQLMQMRGKRHELLSAVVIYEDSKPAWRHVGVVRMMMRPFSEDYLDGYIARNWGSIRNSVGAYKLEEEGVRLFSQIQGDYFTVLGLPLLELLSFLTQRGVLEQ